MSECPVPPKGAAGPGHLCWVEALDQVNKLLMLNDVLMNTWTALHQWQWCLMPSSATSCWPAELVRQ